MTFYIISFMYLTHYFPHTALKQLLFKPLNDKKKSETIKVNL